MKADNQELLKCIEACFSLSMDDRLPQARQNELLALGKRLRGSLMNLLTAEFPEDLKKVGEANRQLQEATKRLGDKSEAIAHIADTVKDVGNLVTALDGLLKFAMRFM